MIDLRKNKQYSIPSFEEWKSARDEEAIKNCWAGYLFVIGSVVFCVLVWALL